VFSGDRRRSLDAGSRVYRLEKLAFSPDGSNLAVSDLCRGIRIWDVATGREQAGFWAHVMNARNVAYSADGHIAMAIEYHDAVKISDVSMRRERTISLGTFRTIFSAFSPDGASLAIGDMDGTVRVWDLNRLVSTESGTPVLDQ
jgi:WD40 repeat protein